MKHVYIVARNGVEDWEILGVHDSFYKAVNHCLSIVAIQTGATFTPDENGHCGTFQKSSTEYQDSYDIYKRLLQ